MKYTNSEKIVLEVLSRPNECDGNFIVNSKSSFVDCYSFNMDKRVLMATLHSLENKNIIILNKTSMSDRIDLTDRGWIVLVNKLF